MQSNRGMNRWEMARHKQADGGHSSSGAKQPSQTKFQIQLLKCQAILRFFGLCQGHRFAVISDEEYMYCGAKAVKSVVLYPNTTILCFRETAKLIVVASMQKLTILFLTNSGQEMRWTKIIQSCHQSISYFMARWSNSESPSIIRYLSCHWSSFLKYHVLFNFCKKLIQDLCARYLSLFM